MREHVNDQTVERDRYVIKVLCRLWLLNSAEMWAGTACNQSMTKKDSVSIVRLRKRLAKCTVCGAACAPNSVEGLCWVCRRLKISAWRDSDQQTAQE